MQVVDKRFYRWDVFLNGKKINSLSYVSNMSAEEIKKSLIDREGFDSRIVIKKQGTKK